MRVAKTGEELLAICKEEGIKLSEYALRCEMQSKNLSKEEVLEKLSKTLEVMKKSSSKGREEEVYSLSGLIGGDAFKLQKYLESGKSFTGNGAILAMAMAISSSEVNASMGKIIACPTAGSCGILPAVMLTAKERLNLQDEDLLYGLLAASAIGLIIGKKCYIFRSRRWMSSRMWLSICHGSWWSCRTYGSDNRNVIKCRCNSNKEYIRSCL